MGNSINLNIIRLDFANLYSALHSFEGFYDISNFFVALISS